ncbi:MAG: endonuclease VIII [Sandaracinus sp.]|nr:endonuclease VIII [Sandaracinus sp.]
MPEGPEVHRAAARVREAIEGQHALAVELGLERLKAWEPVLRGQRVRSVEARGKAVLVAFESGHTVYAHGQLYGRWMVRNRGSMPETNRQLRFAVHTHAKSALLYSASEIEVVREDEVDAIPYLARIGPDVLDPAVDEKLVRARLRDSAFARRQLAHLYLDQSFLAGMGNYLRSEVLFLAQVWPTLRPADLDAATIRRLAKESLEVPRRSFATGGITVRDRLATRLKSEGLSRRAMRHYVFGRPNRACRVCEARIRKERMAGRRIYVCSGCQSEPG